MEKKELGAVIEERRKLFKMTRKELAQKAGISLKTVYAIERYGDKNVKLETLERIAEALYCTLIDIVGELQIQPQEDEPLEAEEIMYAKKYEYGRIYSIAQIMIILPLLDDYNLS